MKLNFKNYCLAFIYIGVLVWLDQFTKALAVEHLKDKAPIVLIENVFEFHYTENIGAAFSSMLGKTAFLLTITALISIVVIYFYTRIPNTKKWLFFRILLLSIVAGGVGNFIDRVRYAYVVDFLYFKLINFPIFNVADIYVTVSAILCFVAVFWVYKDADWEEIKQNMPGKRKNNSQ